MMKKYRIINKTKETNEKIKLMLYVNFRNTESVVTCIHHVYELWSHNSKFYQDSS